MAAAAREQTIETLLRRRRRCVRAHNTQQSVRHTSYTHTHTAHSLRHTHSQHTVCVCAPLPPQRGTHYTHTPLQSLPIENTCIVDWVFSISQTLRALCRSCTGQVMPVKWRKASSKSRVLGCCVLRSVCVCASARIACRCVSCGGRMRACSRSRKASKEARV